MGFDLTMMFANATGGNLPLIVAVACVFCVIGIAFGIMINNYIQRLQKGAAQRDASRMPARSAAMPSAKRSTFSVMPEFPPRARPSKCARSAKLS